MRITLEQAQKLLKAGNVVGLPTETVYGLAASIRCPKAIAHIFFLKGRPSNNPLIIHVASAQDILSYALTIPDDFHKLAAAFWPGPLTLVLPIIADKIPAIARAGLPTAAFRVPAHDYIQKLLTHSGPLVMPSANLSGKPSATSAAHVENDFGQDFPVVEGGQCTRGMESTILLWKDDRWCIVRLGALASIDFQPVLGYSPVVHEEEIDTPLCPGQLYRHYAPKAKLVLKENISGYDGVVVGFDDRHYPHAERVFSLGNSQCAEEVAQRLYAVLRDLDTYGVKKAYIDMNIPHDGLWATIWERMKKASSCAESNLA